MMMIMMMYGTASVSRPARTYLHQHYTDKGYSLEHLPGATDERNRWEERVRETRALST